MLLLATLACSVENIAPLPSSSSRPSGSDTGWAEAEFLGEWVQVDGETEAEDEEGLSYEQLVFEEDNGLLWRHENDNWLIVDAEGTWAFDDEGRVSIEDDRCGSPGLYEVGLLPPLLLVQGVEDPCEERVLRTEAVWMRE